MSFKQKLRIAFTTIILLPTGLLLIAFLVVGNLLARAEGANRLLDYSGLSEDVRSIGDHIDEVYEKILEDHEKDPSITVDKEYLSGISEELTGKNIYILVRKGNSVYYSGNEEDAAEILFLLPAYGNESGSSAGYYMTSNSRMFRQLDLEFPDGEKGSLFVVSQAVPLGSRKLLTGMFVTMFAILLITAILITQWLKKSLFQPVDSLAVAMGNIRDGNLEYMLSTTEKGEIGELYQSYEDMRLRLKESTEEKIENEKHDRELISNICHDLKTPITAIKGYVEGLIDGVANTPEKQEKYLRTIYNKANDMDNLINELTLYSRIDSNKILYNFQRINVADYFGDCVEEIGMDLESRGIELNYINLVTPDTMIIADPEQLKRVINNIISNSVKYMDKPKGKIDIRILDEQDSVRFEIEDNGKGIATRDLPNIFNRFYRTDSSRNSAQGGSGIGLSIVKKIIEDHGGYIWATSKEGWGTCQHFVLRKYREKGKSEVNVDSQEA